MRSNTHKDAIDRAMHVAEVVAVGIAYLVVGSALGIAIALNVVGLFRF